MGDPLDAALRENLVLRVMLGAGCDANNDGLHAIMNVGRDEFCTQCGEMTKGGKSKAWFSEERLERIKDRLTPSIKGPGG